MLSVTFSPVSPQVFSRIQELVFGIHEGSRIDDATVSVHDVVCRYSYDATNSAFRISVVSTPSIIAEGYVVGWLHDAIGRLEIKGN